MRSTTMRRFLLVVVGLLCAAPALASRHFNNGFDNGTLGGWTTEIPYGGFAVAATSGAGYVPVSGSHFAFLKTDGPGSYTTLRRSYYARPGDTISGQAFFRAGDYFPYDDNAVVEIKSGATIIATVFAASVSTVGDFGATPWTPWSFTFTSAGTYTVELRVTNAWDGVNDSHAGLDNVAFSGRSRLAVGTGCSEYHLANWPGWTSENAISSAGFLSMTATDLSMYDVLDIGCGDGYLDSGAGRAKIAQALTLGLGVYSESYYGSHAWAPGSVSLSGWDGCTDNVSVTPAGAAHPVFTAPDPDLTAADLVPVGCAIHNSFGSVSGEYVSLARSNDSNFPVLLASEAFGGRIFLRTHHYHWQGETRAQRFIDSVAKYLLGGWSAPPPVNNAPVAVNDEFGAVEDTVLTVPTPGVMANDTDADGDPLHALLVSPPATGTVSLATNGGLTYVPPPNFFGSVGFTYKVNDGQADSNTATVTVNVAPVNDAPVAASASVATAEDLELAVNLSATDIDSALLTFVVISGPSNGTLAGVPPNLTYQPNLNFNGSDTFTFKANDGSLDSNVATITIAVSPVNDAPVLDAIGNRSVDELVELAFAISASDVENDPLTFSMTGPDGATLTGTAFAWTPSEEQGPGSYPITFTVSDGELSDSETITVQVNEVNVAPILGSIGNQTVDEETALTFTATATDSDLPANTLSFSLVGAPTGASIDASTGAFSWTPAEADGPGTHSFDVVVTDNGSPAMSDSETITVTVNEVNVAPVLGEIANVTTQWDDEVTFTATATDHDIPANTLTFSLVGAPAGASINASSGLFTWDPASSQIGVHTFDVVVTDNGTPNLSDSQSVTITVTKRATALVYGGDTSEQYSDTTNVSATLTDLGSGAPISGRTIEFELGAQDTSAVTDGSGVAASTITVDQMPAAYTVESDFNGDALYFPSSDSDDFTITREDAAVTYSGTLYTSTSCAECSTGGVMLAATVQDSSLVSADAEPGNILNATLTFVNRDLAPADPNYVLCTAPLGLVTSGDYRTAAGTCMWNADIGAAESAQYTIGMIVGGWYVRDASEDNTVVTVAKPIAGSINGGGYLINVASAGLKPGETGKKTNFGFNVRYNKSGKKLQGNINIIVRNGGRVYQLKGNAMTSLAIDKATNGAVFNGKANIQDITDPLNPIAIDGNASLQVEMIDAGEPGDHDSIGITLWDKNGGLWFSSRWDGVKTIKQLLDGGNLQVR